MATAVVWEDVPDADAVPVDVHLGPVLDEEVAQVAVLLPDGEGEVEAGKVKRRLKCGFLFFKNQINFTTIKNRSLKALYS